jgi:hypothetical protein
VSITPLQRALIGAGLAVASAVAITGCVPATSSSSTRKAAQPSPAVRFASDIKGSYPALVGQTAALAKLGNDICSKRSDGAAQADIIRVIQNGGGLISNPQEFVRIAEKDLCPSELAPVIAVAPLKPKVVARFSGSGIQTTAQFMIAGSGNWVLKWSYNCSSFGMQGNFIVNEDNGNDLNGATVNELNTAGHGETHVYSDAGRHYLSINSECDWSVKVVQL